MTCLEKYMKENPKANPTNVMEDMCPNGSGGINIDDPEYCDTRGGAACARCWNREVPGEETAEPVTTIKDSGTRLEFSTGAVRDIQKGKGRCDLLPLDVISDIFRVDIGPEDPAALIFDKLYRFTITGEVAHLFNTLGDFVPHAFADWPDMLLEVSMHFEEGAEKYGVDNWKKGLPVRCYINSAIRHYLKWFRGDADEYHHRAFCWNLLCAIWTCIHKPELNEYGQKVCPVCNTVIPDHDNDCPNCRVFTGTPDFDPDSMMGEFEEENE